MQLTDPPNASSPASAQNFMVHWRARILVAQGDIREGIISAVRQGGFNLMFEQALSIGKEIGLEFHVKFENQKHKIRIKALVQYCELKSNNSGALLILKTSMIDKNDNHTLNNVIHTFLNSKEVNLRL